MAGDVTVLTTSTEFRTLLDDDGDGDGGDGEDVDSERTVSDDDDEAALAEGSDYLTL